MSLPANFSEVIWHLALSQRKLDAAFNEIQNNVDAEIFKIRKENDLLVDEMLKRLLLNGEPELMKLMKSSRTVQDRWLAQLRKKLGLNEKEGNITKMNKEKQVRALPSAAEMFKAVQAGKPVMSYHAVSKQEDSELETCIINHMENDGMTREEATEDCRGNTGDVEDREAALSRDKSKSTEDLFKALMEKKGHNVF